MIAIIDYKMGNVRSVAKAFETVGAVVSVTASVSKLRKAKALVLPGVGAFPAGMKNVRALGLIPEIRRAVCGQKPFLGICLGMQLLFTSSEEHGVHQGLNLISGDVVRFRSNLKIPHMGWNTLQKTAKTNAEGRRTRDEKGIMSLSARELMSNKLSENDLLEGIPEGAYFYFVHSYYVKPAQRNVILATSEYGRKFACVVGKGNTFGIQFHPEKSAELGLKIIENFCRIAGEIA